MLNNFENKVIEYHIGLRQSIYIRVLTYLLSTCRHLLFAQRLLVMCLTSVCLFQLAFSKG